MDLEIFPLWIVWVLAGLAVTAALAGSGFFLVRYIPHWVWWAAGGVVVLALAAIVTGFVFVLMHMPD